MPKVKISEYSATANSNTDVASINIDEGCAPSGINNAIRAIMGHLKDFQQGTNGDPFNGPVNGTLGATTASTANVTTLTTSSTVTHNGGTANGVAYLNGSKVLTTGSALVFDGTNLGLGVTPPTSTDAGNITIKGGSTLNFSTASANIASNATFNSGWKYIATAAAVKYTQSGAEHQWFNAASGTAGNAITFTQAMTLDASSNLGIGTTSPSTYSAYTKLSVLNGIAIGVDASNAGRIVGSTTTGTELSYLTMGGNYNLGSTGEIALATSTAKSIIFGTNGTERARITSSGFFKASNDGTYFGSTVTYHELRSSTNDEFIARLSSTTATSPYGLYIRYTGATPNGTLNDFFNCSDPTALRFSARSNGGLANYSANDVNLSDRREKTNFAPAKSYLDVICSIPVQTFNYIDQNMEDDGGLTLGVVAQDVQAVAPELVMESDWGTEEEPKMRLSIYQTDLQYALMKALQELKAEFDAYKASHP